MPTKEFCEVVVICNETKETGQRQPSSIVQSKKNHGMRRRSHTLKKRLQSAAIVHFRMSANNAHAVLRTHQACITSMSCGAQGFRGARRKTHAAAYALGGALARSAAQHNIRDIIVLFRGLERAQLRQRHDPAREEHLGVRRRRIAVVEVLEEHLSIIHI